MSNGLAKYTFLPWLRRGIATEISRQPGDGSTGPRAEIPITVSIDIGQDDPDESIVNLALFGPGEVTGIDRRMIIRTYPEANAFDVESNYFPLIEFDQPDFPWRYSPAAPDAQKRISPWLVLIALEEAEFDLYGAADIPTISVTNANSLPKLDQSWSWAHVQVTGVVQPGEEVLQDIVLNEPERILSRLFCPRYLKPLTAYTVFLVPVYERGRLAGLREEVSEDVDALTPAWIDNAENIALPFYHKWRFQTGTGGDFEALVRQLLPPTRLPDNVGRREIDMSQPGAGLPAASGEALEMEGALMLLGSREGEGQPKIQDLETTFIDGLEERLNRPVIVLENDVNDPIVAPPLYGRWHAMEDRLVLPQAEVDPTWFHELNADPRLRTIAGLAAQVVIDQQEQLMGAAWDQMEGIRETNESLRQAQLAETVADRVRARHVVPLGLEDALLVTAPVHGLFLNSPQTVKETLKNSPIAKGAFEGQFRRICRPQGPIGKRLKRLEREFDGGMLEGMNQGLFSPAPKPETPDGLPTPSLLGAGLAPPWATPAVINFMKAIQPWLIGLAVIFWLLTLGLYARSITVAAISAVLGFLFFAAAWMIRRRERRLTTATRLRDGKLTGKDIMELRPAAPSKSAGSGLFSPTLGFVQTINGGFNGEDQTTAELRLALAALFDEINAVPPEEEEPPVVANLRELRENIVAGLDPAVTIAEPIKKRLIIPPEVDWRPKDPLEPIMAAPSFSQAMYEPLRELSQEWLLPGVGNIPANTIALLESNQHFIECYMAGLNHEMARELLWREYPTDQRGTYFRQFWDVRALGDESGAPLPIDERADIKPIDEWTGRTLGSNSVRTASDGSRQFVLLIRGEVLRRYPNTIIYANNDILNAENLRVLGEERHYPIFRGTLEPDITFIGFDIPGQLEDWFFVLQEPPTAPRFGLDAAGADADFGQPLEAFDPDDGSGGWPSLSWGHLVADEAALDALTYIDLAGTLPDTSALHGPPDPSTPDVRWHIENDGGTVDGTSSDIAYISLQSPFRVAIHGSDMLPDSG